VTDFRVTHLIVREADIGAAGFDQGVGIGMPKGIHHRGLGRPDGVMAVVVAVAPSIQDAEHNRRNRSVLGGLRRTCCGPRVVRARFGGRYGCHPIKPRLSLHDQMDPTYLLPCAEPVLSMVASAFGYTMGSHAHRAPF